MDVAETMRQFALALLEAADGDGDVGAMTRYLVPRSDVLDGEAMVAISTVALTFMAMTAGTNVRTAAESIWRAVDDQPRRAGSCAALHLLVPLPNA